MKRAIRSVVLAGVIVIISILLSAPQPVRADKFPTIFRVGYTGSIKLRVQAVMDMDNPDSAFYYTFFETQGPIDISYDKKRIKIRFDPWNILQGTGASGIYGAVLSGSAGSTTAYGGGVFADAPYNTAFDFFTIAFSVIDPKFTAQNCWQTKSDPCSKILWNTMAQRVRDLATFVTHMHLQIHHADGKTLSGSCTLPGWDELWEPHMKYSETCSWAAHLWDSEDFKPEWTRKK